MYFCTFYVEVPKTFDFGWTYKKVLGPLKSKVQKDIIFLTLISFMFKTFWTLSLKKFLLVLCFLLFTFSSLHDSSYDSLVISRRCIPYHREHSGVDYVVPGDEPFSTQRTLILNFSVGLLMCLFGWFLEMNSATHTAQGFGLSIP